MFGFGESKPAEPAQPAAMNFSSSNAEEKIQMAVGFLSMNSCERQVLNLQRCAENNNLDPNDEQRLTRVCGSEINDLNSCMQSVNEEEVIGALGAISAQACPQDYQRLERCAQQHGGNPEPCAREFMETLACGADHILGVLQQAAQNQAPSGSSKMW